MTGYELGTEDVRKDFTLVNTRNHDGYMTGRSLESERERYGAEFDRWLNLVKADALRDAAFDFEITTHAWGKLAMIEHLRTEAKRIEAS
jgi:hypothetical protein